MNVSDRHTQYPHTQNGSDIACLPADLLPYPRSVVVRLETISDSAVSQFKVPQPPSDVMAHTKPERQTLRRIWHCDCCSVLCGRGGESYWQQLEGEEGKEGKPRRV